MKSVVIFRAMLLAMQQVTARAQSTVSTIVKRLRKNTAWEFSTSSKRFGRQVLHHSVEKESSSEVVTIICEVYYCTTIRILLLSPPRKLNWKQANVLRARLQLCQQNLRHCITSCTCFLGIFNSLRDTFPKREIPYLKIRVYLCQCYSFSCSMFISASRV